VLVIITSKSNNNITWIRIFFKTPSLYDIPAGGTATNHLHSVQHHVTARQINSSRLLLYYYYDDDDDDRTRVSYNNVIPTINNNHKDNNNMIL